jgi:hypothetical protein
VVEPLGGTGHVGADGGNGQRLLDRAEREVAAHAGGEVDHDVDIAGPDTLDDLGVQARVARRLTRERVAHVDVGDRGAGAGGGDAVVGDLLGRHRHLVALAGGVPRTGHGTGDERFAGSHHTSFRSLSAS